MEGKERKIEILQRQVVIMLPSKEKKFLFSIGLELKETSMMQIP